MIGGNNGYIEGVVFMPINQQTMAELVDKDPGWGAIIHVGPSIAADSIAGIAFGSRVTGVSRSESDYDLGVIVPRAPELVRTIRMERIMQGKTQLPVHIFWMTPEGIAWKQPLDIAVYNLVHRGILLWGTLGPWWKPLTLSNEGIADILRTVESLTDENDWTDLSTKVARYAWHLLAYTRLALGQTMDEPLAPQTLDNRSWATAIQNEWHLLHDHLNKSGAPV